MVRSIPISNSSKLSCMLSLPASMKRIRSRTAEKKWRHSFSHYKPLGDFFRRSRAVNSAVGGPIRPKFELVRALMHVIVTCKYEKERMKNNREKVETPFFPIITLSVTIETSGWIWPNFKIIQALMYVIITCKYEKDPIKNSRKSGDIVFPIISLWGFFQMFKGQPTPQSVVRAGRNLKSSELSCMSSLPASMKRIG